MIFYFDLHPEVLAIIGVKDAVKDREDRSFQVEIQEMAARSVTNQKEIIRKSLKLASCTQESRQLVELLKRWGKQIDGENE